MCPIFFGQNHTKRATVAGPGQNYTGSMLSSQRPKLRTKSRDQVFMGSEKHFRKSRGRTVHKTCTGVTFPGLQKKNSLQKIRVCRKKGSSFNGKMHRSAKCFLFSMSNAFFTGIIL